MPQKVWTRVLVRIYDKEILISSSMSLGFLCGSAGNESICNAGDLGSIPGFGRSTEEGKGYPLQYSGLENSMDCIVHGVTELDMTEQLSQHVSKLIKT